MENIKTFILTLVLAAFAMLAEAQTFSFGAAENTDGIQWLVDSKGFVVGGKHCVPVMGEIHYARVPERDWRRELLKMKAGGITVVSTYVFWIHHEAEEGKWDWAGNKNLRHFVELCKELEMPLILRLGPFCHGEVYQGGMPDWIVERSINEGFKLRTNSRQWMEATKQLYTQIGNQVKGLMWKDGGPIVGVQVENESRGPWAYLAQLKQMAIEAGFDVPFYTRTGWPQMSGKAEFGEILPLYGDYADGFWDRVLTDMPGEYSDAFTFKGSRLSAVIATETFGTNQSTQMEKGDLEYPYLTCELGGGMNTAYHRRINIFPKDALALAICKVGSGSNLPGYYMYHGGTNPQGNGVHPMSELQNSRVTNYNDVPQLTYDFQAPLGEMGQMNPSFHPTRILHQMLADWGEQLAMWDVVFPETNTEKGNVDNHLRWTVRTDGERGILFVNNYQRMKQLSRKSIRFTLMHDSGQIQRFPLKPIAIPEGASFCMPVNIDGIDYALAQLFCRTTDCTYLVAVDGIVPIIGIDGKEVIAKLGKSITIPSTGRKVCVLSQAEANQLYKIDGRLVKAKHGGVAFRDGTRIVEEYWTRNGKVNCKQTQADGGLRTIRMGGQKVAEQPSDADFEQAAVWTIQVPEKWAAKANDLFLEISYKGDVARVYADGKMVEDNFWNGKPMLVRVADLIGKQVELRILPLGKDYPIYLQQAERTQLASAPDGRLLSLDDIELIERRVKQ